MADEKKTVRVTIFGEDYALRSEMGEQYTISCAQHVDEAIQSAHVSGHVSEPHKAAILGALQITDDLFRSQASEKALARSVVERIDALRQMAAAAIKAGP